ncbi:phosphonate ABC transporter ATP-binding protein [Senegalia massiliensis]|uniref:Phosphonate ABC transporter ATP-binding protein n=1 Tax=Senegalia massiliensis TaxID=1720316 RepID=A0A845QXK8_9CLOT|nr:phosphonate ABC transporter ATP-binding protein [Senegalia massiliensis]NBI05878.1 phosphonate ABC transporter ATP-binding protein [Senegalia massiliensis]
MTSKEIIKFKNITKKFKGNIALSSLSFNINKGELVALIGPSGSGKTTLLNLLSKIQTANTGDIFIENTNIKDYKSNKLYAKKVGMIRQQFDLIDELTVINNVLAGRLNEWNILKSLLSLIIPQEKKLAVNALKRVGIEEKLFAKTSTLSGGQQQRVALARLLVQNPNIILADEPVSSLDPTRAEDVLSLLISLAKENNKTLITSIHSIKYAKKYFDRVIGLRNGELFFDLPVNELNEGLLTELYSLKKVNNNE